MCYLQDLKYKILVKGKKERVAEGCSSCSDLSSSDEESIRSDGKPKAKKEDKKVGMAAAAAALSVPYFTVESQHKVTPASCLPVGLTKKFDV